MLHFSQLFNRFETPTHNSKINKTNCRPLLTLDHNYRAAPKSVFGKENYGQLGKCCYHLIDPPNVAHFRHVTAPQSSTYDDPLAHIANDLPNDPWIDWRVFYFAGTHVPYPIGSRNATAKS